jgi:hypothetical protein
MPDGVVVYNPPDAHRSFSSVYTDSATGEVWSSSMLDSASAWAPVEIITGDEPWMKLDLDMSMYIAGIVVQGSGSYQEWVTEVKIETSVDNVSWTIAFDTTAASQDTDTFVHIYFPTLIRARYVRITPLGFETKPAMRAGVLQNPGMCRALTPTLPYCIP